MRHGPNSQSSPHSDISPHPPTCPLQKLHLQLLIPFVTEDHFHRPSFPSLQRVQNYIIQIFVQVQYIHS
jgi:hypothetical protein